MAEAPEVRGQSIVVRYYTTLEECRQCQLLFIAASVPQSQQDEVVRKLKGAPILLVGETEGFAARGGCINFYRDRQNVRFEINIDAGRGQHLQFNAQLLKVARLVKGE